MSLEMICTLQTDECKTIEAKPCNDERAINIGLDR